MGAYLRNFPEYFGDKPVRDVGLIASEGRMSIPIEDGTPAGLLDFRHHYFEFIPEEQAGREQPETVGASDLIEGRNYFVILSTAGGLYRYNIFDMIRCVGYIGKAPLIEFLNKGAHISSLTGEKLSEHQVVGAVEAAQRALGLRLKSYILLPTWGEPPFYSLLVESSDLGDYGACEQFADRLEEELQAQNVEYTSKRETLRLGPVRIRRIPDGSWQEFQKRRLARSGGTVEQYKQPHLIPDIAEISSFRLLDADSVASSGSA